MYSLHHSKPRPAGFCTGFSHIAFERTSIPNGRNMHRNVFFLNDEGPRAPYSSFDSYHPEATRVANK